ncbi:hypothetical protein ABMA57_12435 [Saccharospirillum sp. HFRX-1]|uniref:hypothetical protein n=1 Tax=unclassified Saccharospirillum TaxID=2633430 RepID=UPI00371612E7
MLAACSSANTISEAAEWSISVQASNEPVTPLVVDDVLTLGQTKIWPWLEPAPDCTACELRIERRHSPVGPDLILSLYQQEELRWRLIDSRQPQLRLSDGSLIQHQGDFMRWRAGDETIEMTDGQSLDWLGCRQSLNWLATPPLASPQGTLPESTTTRLQLTTTCPSP